MKVACVGEAASALISAGRHPPYNGVDQDAVSVCTIAKTCVADALQLFLRFATAFNEFLKTTITTEDAMSGISTTPLSLARSLE